ncbi:glycosyltransferase [Sciscionella sediminilitoris]|uniref:glycosyltransferase n=1 Tax=Sciscionella sediminilitoris TaxID=1445613 RepID=UPI0004DF4DC3|nr:glycosyltransferase [Sciscionella sp. SE31]
MRVLLSTYGTRGDVEPLVALAVRLRTLGVQVRMCTPSDEDFAGQLGGFGIPLVPVGPPVGNLMRRKTPPSAEEFARYRTELVDAQFAAFPAAFEDCDAVVAAGLAQIATRSVAESAGIPYVYTSYSAINLPSPHHAPPPRSGWPEPEESDNPALWRRDAEQVNAQFKETLNGHRSALGLPPVDNVRDHVYTERPWLAADPVLGPWREIPDLDVVQTGAWTLPDERPLPDELVAFLDAGEPPVYVGFGSVRPSPDIVRRAVEAIRAHGRRALVSGNRADLEVIGEHEDCFALGEVNQQRLFTRVAAVVHHGGAGTTLTAAKAGTPQVVAAIQLADTPYWAGRVADLGIGVALDGPAVTGESLSAALKTVLAPEARDRARQVGTEIRTDGAEVAANRLLELLR